MPCWPGSLDGSRLSDGCLMPAFNARVRPQTILGLPDKAFYMFVLALFALLLSMMIPFHVVRYLFFGLTILLALGALVIFLNKNRLLIMPSIKASKQDGNLRSFLGRKD